MKPMRGFYCQKVLPAVYDDSLSYYEVLCKLTEAVRELQSIIDGWVDVYVTKAELSASQDEQDARWAAELQDAYDELMDALNGEVDRLEKMIAEVVAGQVTVFDPTYGIKPRPVDTVIRNVYHWLRYYADYASTIDGLNLTAKTRDDYQVGAKNFDLFSMLYYSHGDMPSPAPEDVYAKKHDILAYYFDRKGIQE